MRSSTLVSTLASVALPIVSLVMGFERSASACSPPAHRETVVSPQSGGTMPASSPGFVVSAEEGVGLTLLDANGAAVDGALKKDRYWTYFAPASPLATGSYTVRYETWAASGTTKDATLTVTEKVAAPTRTGTLDVEGTSRTIANVPTSSGSCVEEADLSIVDLALDVDPSLTPYEDVVVWRTTVDGEYWLESQLGPSAPPSTSQRGTLRLYTACDSNGTAGRDDGVVAGVHDVEVTPTLIGGTATIAPAKIRVIVSCGADSGTVITPSSPDDPPFVGNDPVDPADPGSDPTAGSTPPTQGAGGASSSSGCSSAPAPIGGDVLAFVVAGVLARARVRRRSNRPKSGN